MLAPIVLFVYNRPWHTEQLLESLSANQEASETILYIYCDGPKQETDEDNLQKILKTRDVVKKENRFEQVIIIEQLINKGLANSIIDGVTEVINKYNKVIVLEDDLKLSPYFLYYMNDSLNRYENNNRVGQIGGCNFFACGSKFPTTFFTPIPDSLGWATWKNRWNHFNPDANLLLKELEEKKLIDKFNVFGAYDMIGMLKMQIEGKVSSWAIRWQAVCVINDWLSLYPNPSVTNHIESIEATHANINITPPLCLAKPGFKKIKTVVISNVIIAMKRGFSNTGDFYGNLKVTSNVKSNKKNQSSVFYTSGLKLLKKIKGKVYG